VNPAVELAEEALAAARLTQLITSDALPVIARPRSYLAQRYEGTSFGYLLTCPHCVAVWAAGFGLAAHLLAPRAWQPVRRALAAAMVAGHTVARLEL
jgi:hypothetical protein